MLITVTWALDENQHKRWLEYVAYNSLPGGDLQSSLLD